MSSAAGAASEPDPKTAAPEEDSDAAGGAGAAGQEAKELHAAGPAELLDLLIVLRRFGHYRVEELQPNEWIVNISRRDKPSELEEREPSTESTVLEEIVDEGYDEQQGTISALLRDEPGWLVPRSAGDCRAKLQAAQLRLILCFLLHERLAARCRRRSCG